MAVAQAAVLRIADPSRKLFLFWLWHVTPLASDAVVVLTLLLERHHKKSAHTVTSRGGDPPQTGSNGLALKALAIPTGDWRCTVDAVAVATRRAARH